MSLSDVADAALDELLPLWRMGMANDSVARRRLVSLIAEEGIFALADRLEQSGKFRGMIRFDVCASGDRRGLAREEAADQIDALLEAVQQEAGA